MQESIQEIVVNGRSVKEKNENANEVKLFWESVGGMNYVNVSDEVNMEMHG